ncbi:hypothetical protein JDV09_18770 [Mycobacterium sp. Y57]|uniref:hypothetical protein n=1 Tax=Mycolicibacterium xanthum TaxID=2796469 RepID=UPI001C85488A|nr:hypothetical protein [Mycolicibacterium xanthum]MBX7434143.1 hypothetical protein [Mycolicibacterium xanthum]
MAIHRTAPIVAAGAFAAVFMSTAVAGAVPVSGFSAAPAMGLPVPQTSEFCTMGLYCDDDSTGLVLNPRSQRADQNFGGGPLTPRTPNN